jgi:hypothetical protein
MVKESNQSKITKTSDNAVDTQIVNPNIKWDESVQFCGR